MIDRRTTLAGMTAAGLDHALGATAAAKLPPAAASLFGEWSTDDHGLPCYVFTGEVPVKTSTPAGRPYPLDPDPVFLLGNYDVKVFVTPSGAMQFISGEHGWVRLNGPATARGNSATLTVTQGDAGRTHDLLGIGGVAASGRWSTRTFGCGTARYRLTPQPGLTVERIISVAPSTADHRAEPAVIVTIRLTNTGPAPLDLDHSEMVVYDPTLALNRPSASGVRPVAFVNTARPLPGGRGIVGVAAATSPDPKVLTPIETPNRYNLYPPSLVLAAADFTADTVFDHRVIDGGAIELSARTRLHLATGATRDIVLVVALQSREAAPPALPAFIAALRPSASGDWFRREWAEVLAPLAKVPDPDLRAELQWDGHALLAMATYTAYYDQTFIPQGMTYDYISDFNSGPRDHLQHALGATPFAPGLARSSILYTLCRMTETGAMKFTVSGNGFTADSMWSPSDQSLFLFWALSEYLRLTGDWTILEAATPYLPREAGRSGTVLDKLDRAFIYLRDHVGTGSHGLVRLLTGDWNDQIYFGVPEGHYEEVAESQMNSAMVMAVMPPLIDQLHAYARTRPEVEATSIARLAAAMQVYADRITEAMLRDMDGRTFARRAWLGPDTALGDGEMYLEPQSFLLLARDYPVARKRILLREIERRLMAGEALGPRQRERPPADPRFVPGTSENGGFWYSLAGQAVVGVATFDRAAALKLLDRMTFRASGRRYPGYWVGQWTAPDTLNAVIAGDIAGLPRPMDGGILCRMANYCAHAHAWPIYCYFRIAGA